MLKKILFYVLIIFIVVVSLFSIIQLTKEEPPREVREINYTFSIKEGLGFNLDEDKLHFGGGPTHAILQRELIIASEFDARVIIVNKGPANVIASINDFELQKGENKTIEFNLFVPDISQGLYEGTIEVSFYAK